MCMVVRKEVKNNIHITYILFFFFWGGGEGNIFVVTWVSFFDLEHNFKKVEENYSYSKHFLC